MSYAKKTLTMLLACGLLIGSAAVAGAQGTQGQGYGQQQKQQQGQSYTQTQPAPQQETNLTEQELDKVVDAYVDIREIQTDVEEKLSNVESSEKAKKIQSKGYEKMISTVEANGLDVPSYNSALQDIQADPQLQAQFQQKVDAAR